MRRIVYFVICILLVLQIPAANAGASVETKAQKAWAPFFIKFRAAVKKRDRAALKEMIVSDFFYTLGHHASDHRDAAFDYWDEQKGRGWKTFDRILRLGTVRTSDKTLSNTGQWEGPMRVAPPAAAKTKNLRNSLIDWYAVFQFKDSRWQCITFIECCD